MSEAGHSEQEDPAGEAPFWILALDGGGLRGAFSAHLLKRIEDEFDVALNSRFDLVAGTSTGSILAAAVVLKRPLAAVAGVYAKQGPTIFANRWWSVDGKLAAKYDAIALKTVVEKESVRRCWARLRVRRSSSRPPTSGTAKSTSSSHSTTANSFATRPFASLTRYSLPVLRRRSSRRTTSGTIGWPTAAPGPTTQRWSPPSTRCAGSGSSPCRIRILSIGTGAERFTYPRRPGLAARAWGFMTAWQRGKLIELMLSLQSQAATNMTALLLGKEQVLRLNFFDTRLPMDDPTSITDLRSRADALFTVASEDIRKFLGAERRDPPQWNA